MIEAIELKTAALKGLLGEKDDRIPRLVSAKQRCLEGISNPCGLCGVQGQVARTQWLKTAQDIALVCCPEGKIPAFLKRRLEACSK